MDATVEKKLGRPRINKLGRPCSECPTLLTEETAAKSGAGGYRSQCKPCWNEYQRLYKTGERRVRDRLNRRDRITQERDCSGCGVRLDETTGSFIKSLGGYRSTCKDCHARKEQVSRYGITVADYDRMLEEQGWVCLICERTPGVQRLAVDHCHSTGKVRGLLCHNCNVGLGNAQDSPEILRTMADYLERNS